MEEEKSDESQVDDEVVNENKDDNYNKEKESAEELLSYKTIIKKIGKLKKSETDLDRNKFLCLLGMLYSEPRNPYFNLSHAATVFKLGCNEYADAEAAFWYGRALRLGFGCNLEMEVEVRMKVGTALIQAAAAQGIRRAMFELGLLYEDGFQVTPDYKESPIFPIALNFYDAVARTKCTDKFELIDELEKYIGAQNDDLRLLHDSMASSMNNQISLIFAGQAFLFGATVAAGSSDHYSCLLIILPVLGFVVGLYSLHSTTIAGLVADVDQGEKVLWELYKAKVDACNALLERRRGRLFNNAVALNCSRSRRSMFEFLIALTFPIIWLLVLIEEITEKIEGDWIWWGIKNATEIIEKSEDPWIWWGAKNLSNAVWAVVATDMANVAAAASNACTSLIVITTTAE